MNNSLEKFYRGEHKKLTNQMMKHVGGKREVAEDVVQEAFVRAMRFYPSFDPERGKFYPWFNSIMYNALRDVQRQNNSVVEVEINDCTPEEVLNMGPKGMTEEMRTHLTVTIRSVKNKKHRRVLELFYLMGYSSTEIAMIEAKVSVSNVTTIVMRFRNSLGR